MNWLLVNINERKKSILSKERNRNDKKRKYCNTKLKNYLNYTPLLKRYKITWIETRNQRKQGQRWHKVTTTAQSLLSLQQSRGHCGNTVVCI